MAAPERLGRLDVFGPARLRTPRAAAVAGLLFALLFISSLVAIRMAVPLDPGDTGSWLTADRRPVVLALSLLPFAGIAFLWFVAVLRDRLGENEDRFFATVFLGSGLLYLAMLFASASVAAGVLMAVGAAPDVVVASGVYAFGRAVVYQIVNVYALKMAAVFMVSTSTLAIRTGIFPRWMAYLGYLLAVLLLLSTGGIYWTPLVFPLWVMLISAYILLANLGRIAAAPS
jgi:hypothetical protein